MINYKDRIFNRYRSTSVENPNSQRINTYKGNKFGMYKERWQRFLPADKAARILDIGCGNGDFLQSLVKLGYANVFGVDRSKEQVAAAIVNGLSNVKEADFIKHLEANREPFAVISALSVLEHFDKSALFDAMDAIHQSLVPGGYLFGLVPNSKGPFGSYVRYADITHELSFTPESVVQIAASTGFKPVFIGECGPIPYNPISTLRWAFWQCIRTIYLIARIVQVGDYHYRVYTQDLLFVLQKKSKDEYLKP
jgi:2-polyprenyl-3-methyl-5-hydroxy-6-metoxy-1,4-benzoquinol methylase